MTEVRRVNTPENRADREQVLHHTLLRGRGIAARGAGLRFLASPAPAIDMGEWSYVSQYRPEDLVATVGAGTRLSTIRGILAEQNQWLPLVPVDGGDDTIGGAVASGLEGWFSGSMGRLTDRVLGLRVITPAHGPIFVGSRVVKNVAGYNLPRLFAGTRGALGVITEVTLKVAPRPPVEAIWSEVIDNASVLSDVLQGFLSANRNWTAMALERGPSKAVLYAVWHGRDSVFQTLVKRLGQPNAHGLPTLRLPLENAIVQGAVPRAKAPELLRYWAPEVPVHVDLSTGQFVGGAGEATSWQRTCAWIAEISGGARVIRDPAGELEQGTSKDPLWTGIKRQFDPDGCLADYKG